MESNGEETGNARLTVERVPVAGSCPACGASDLKRYPVVSEGGWLLVTKCQRCLTSLERTRESLLGEYVPLSETL